MLVPKLKLKLSKPFQDIVESEQSTSESDDDDDNSSSDNEEDNSYTKDEHESPHRPIHQILSTDEKDVSMDVSMHSLQQYSFGRSTHTSAVHNVVFCVIFLTELNRYIIKYQL